MTNQAFDAEGILTDRVRDCGAVIPAQRAHDHGAKCRPDGEASTLPGQRQGRAIRGPSEAGDGTRTTGIISGGQDEPVGNDEASGQLINAVDDPFGAETESFRFLIKRTK